VSPLPAPNLERLGRDLEILAGFRDPSALGWTRRVFSAVDNDARDFVAEQMRLAGLDVSVDAGANLVGTLRGTGGETAAVVTGSHTDTVQGGGRFDGIAGVLGAIEAVRCLTEGGVRLGRDLVVVDFLGEEPNDFGLSCVGSRVIAGHLGEDHLRLTDPTGSTLAAALAQAGGDPEALTGARWAPGRVHCFLELHIEQGPVLEQTGVPIGVVTGIAGIHRVRATLEGQPDHAGTTPMDLRRDALCGGAEVILALERLAVNGGVATTGRIHVDPGALNVVPGSVQLWAEARSSDEAWLAGIAKLFETELAAIAARRRLEPSVQWVSREAPVPVTDWVADTIVQASSSLGLDTLALPSGAGHDASLMANLGPMGMLFVPSRDGRSHCPEEWTDLEQIGAGVAVLTEAIALADARRPDRSDRSDR
jgi:beta-ureidopropionase / N-carbamoyl-L-amino-acid hydrolase